MGALARRLLDVRISRISIPCRLIRPHEIFRTISFNFVEFFPRAVIRWSSVRRITSVPKEVSGPLPPGYQPSEVEKGWYAWWEENQHFVKDRQPSEEVFDATAQNHRQPSLDPHLTSAIQDYLV